MMKKISFLFSLLVFGFCAKAQLSNGMDVRLFISPMPNFNYDTNATEEIKVRVRNDGPNNLLGQDSILFSMTIGFGDSTEFYDIKRPVDVFLQPSNFSDYVLIPNYQFKVENNYVICVTANGTVNFPVNITKNARKCVSFVVGIKKHRLEVENIFYADGKINFNLGQSGNGLVQVFDITGKQMLNKNVQLGSESSLNFSPPAKGFYFLKVQLEGGSQAIAKFIVN